MFGGILLFSLVTQEIFSYKKLLTVNEMVSRRMTETEYYLTDVSNSIKHKRLAKEFINESKTHIKDSILSSTRFFFEENHFYQELPQNLKHKLVTSVLAYQWKTFTFFFEDFANNYKAPAAFMERVLT